jgi:hypothetical protein
MRKLGCSMHTDGVLAIVLAVEQSFEVVVIALTAGVIVELTGSGHRIVPVSFHALCAIANSKRL